MCRPLALLPICAVLAIGLATGCTNEPELENRISPALRKADYPDLAPIDQLLEPLPAPQDQALELEQELEARSNRLERRAEALRRATN
ncbi:hypothetical protein [Pseudophaeobacter sp.]|uniref:hypothetical protein n=1 Tax=Pseudophaeobacter sp. TaxID=1971739 RepID=UPI003297DD26